MISYKRSYQTNLNKIKKDDLHPIFPDHSIQPYFDNLEYHLISHIDKAAYVIGCVAWLTNKNILEALASVKGVKIIINKEEYLNSNMTLGQRFYYQCLRGRYNEIPDLMNAICPCCQKNVTFCQNFKEFFPQEKSEDKNHAILTCGIVNNLSKLHHKFLVFINDQFEPYGLWTGSYNLSFNSNYSLENALYITDRKVIDEYLKEFHAIYAYAEHYDWNCGLLSEKKE